MRFPTRPEAVSRGFPPSWLLQRREAEMLGLFAADRIVPHAELEGVIARHRRCGTKGRPLRVHLHYLRAKLLPLGIRIVCARSQGFWLTAESRAVLAPYFGAASAAATAAAQAVPAAAA
jgi:hypothetical protein